MDLNFPFPGKFNTYELPLNQTCFPRSMLILTLVILLINSMVSFGQTTASIKNLDFKLEGDQLVITYDITNYRPKDRYRIDPQIYTVNHLKLEPISLSGDLDSVTGGPGKKIIWDLSKDNIVLDDDIYVMLFGAKLSEPAKAKIKEPESTQKQEPVKQEPIKQLNTQYQPISRGACFFESLVFPGWGTSRLTLNSAHFIKGFLGYGAVIAAYVFNSKANESYDLYKEASTTADRDDYFSETERYTRNSHIFMYGAAAIWSIDLVTVLAVKNKTLTNPSADTRIYVGYGLAFAHTHQLVIRISF